MEHRRAGTRKSSAARENCCCACATSLRPGGFLQYGQGKWYPGEPLPRWAYSCYWRGDGVALWRDPQWLAGVDRDYGYGPGQAQLFAQDVARRLEVGTEYVLDAYEDPLAYVWKERRLPVNVDVSDNKLEDPLESAKLRQVFERGLRQAVGYVLPLRRAEGNNGIRWQSSAWVVRAEELYLIPGDSPVGLRLPLDSLIWEEEKHEVIPVDPTAIAGPLPVPPWHVPAEYSGGGPEPQPTPPPVAPAEPPSRVVRTALVVEPRDGKLWVFIPPVKCCDDYVNLLAAVEDTAANLQMPVMIEATRRLTTRACGTSKCIPTPACSEVNIHPSASWRELVENTTSLYEHARLCHLGTEKFMLDGRHTGTGGGNHPRDGTGQRVEGQPRRETGGGIARGASPWPQWCNRPQSQHRRGPWPDP